MSSIFSKSTLALRCSSRFSTSISGSDAERSAFKKATAGVRAEYEKQATAKARELLKLVDKGKAAFK